LKEWLDEQNDAETCVQTQNQRLDAVFLFYIWMEVNGYVLHSVRVPGVNDHERFTPRLNSRPAKKSTYGRRPSRYGIVSDLRKIVKDRGMLPTPDELQMTELYAACTRLFKLDSAERNQLMLQWYQQTGLRRLEWRALKIEQLPSRKQVEEHRQNFTSLQLRLTKTKGGNTQWVRVLGGLVEQTYEYIDGERASIVKRFRKRRGYVCAR
jgi:integrase